MTATLSRSVRIGERDVPVVLPNRRDPRLHTAAVILSIHAIGILFLGFQVSVPQILSAIATAAVIDVAMTYRQSEKLVWPASGMLTGSGVALILRYVPTSSGEYWSWAGWYWFAAVAGASILSKYLIRWRGDHVFNPSNLGLVVAFLVVSRRLIEPLDFWWAPLDFWMVVAYVLIVGGGVLITRRLGLLEMAVVFWAVLVVATGLLAASGHCMVATWSPTPVCDVRFWTTIATSPEVLVFLFFMITDPKTIPRGRASRVVFAATLAVLATILMAPQTLEYGTKVALLGSLVLWSPLRWAFDRILGTTSTGSGLVGLATRLAGPGRKPSATFGQGFVIGIGVVVAALGIVLAGAPAREQALATPTNQELPIEVDRGTVPAVSVDESASRIAPPIDQETADEIAVMLAENLALEAEAVRTVDAGLLALANGGERLTEIQARIDAAIANGDRPVDVYQFDTLGLRLAGEAEGQTSAALAFDTDGTITTVTYDAGGSEIDSSSQRFSTTFVMRQLAGDRWLIVRADDTSG